MPKSTGGSEPISGFITAAALGVAAKKVQSDKKKKTGVVGGEPITVSAAVATGLLTAVEELYRKRKSKSSLSGGAYNEPVLGSPINTTNNLLLQSGSDADAVNWRYSPAAQNGGNKKQSKTRRGGSWPADVNSPSTLMGGKDNKNENNNQRGGDPSIGVTHDFSSNRNTMYAGVDQPLTILMPQNPSVQQVGGKKKKDKKQRGGDPSDGITHDFSANRNTMYAGVDQPLTILMQQNGASPAPQVGGKNKKDNKKQRGGDPVAGVTHDFSGNRYSSIGAPIEGDYNISTQYTSVSPAVHQAGGKNKKLRGGDPVAGVTHDFSGNRYSTIGAPIVGGDNDNDKKKKLVGGLTELANVLKNLSKNLEKEGKKYEKKTNKLRGGNDGSSLALARADSSLLSTPGDWAGGNNKNDRRTRNGGNPLTGLFNKLTGKAPAAPAVVAAPAAPAAPEVATPVAAAEPVSPTVGGKKKHRKMKGRGDTPFPYHTSEPTLDQSDSTDNTDADGNMLGSIGGKKSKKNNKKNDKKLVGGLLELTNALANLTNA